MQTKIQKFTPGPWIDGSDTRGSPHQMHYVSKNYDHDLCDGHIAYVEHQADARLIAAAPDLYAFACAYRESLTDRSEADFSAEEMEILDMADKAIAKAESK